MSIENYARVFDFGNGPLADNIYFSLTRGKNNPEFKIYNGSAGLGFAVSSIPLVLGQWQFLAITFNGTTRIIYLNAIQVGSNSLSYVLPTINRTKNYIGKSNWAIDGYSSSYLDDLRFYRTSLNQSQISEQFLSIDAYQSLGISFNFMLHLSFD